MATADIQLFDIMTHPLYRVDVRSTVEEALELAQARRIHHLPVFAGEELCGIVCTCDLRDGRLDDTVRTVMQQEVVALPSYESARAAAELMQKCSVGSVVVTHGSKPCGMVTREHLARHGWELAELMDRCRCSSCGSQQHLRLRDDGSYLCVDCLERSAPEQSMMPELGFDSGRGD